MKRFITIAVVPVLGIGLVLFGFVYDLLLAGIPYQDPTPELQSRWEFHKFVAGLFLKTGGIVFLLGLLAAPFLLKLTKRKVQKTDAVAAVDF